MNLARRSIAPAIIILIIALALAGCAAPAATPPATSAPVPPTATPAPTTTMPPAATPAPAAMTTTNTPARMPTPTPTTAAMTPADTPAPTDPPPAASEGAVFTLAEGSIARYKVEEVLANTGFKVATGETTDVSGRVAFDADGNVVAAESRIAVQVATLRTDSNRRDGYVRNRTLETDAYPEVVFQPTAIGWTEPPVGELRGIQDFTIAGNLTVKAETRPVVWNATAEFRADGTATGQASVEFTFADFGMTKPSVAIVLSVEDIIRLELDFVGQFAPQ